MVYVIGNRSDGHGHGGAGGLQLARVEGAVVTASDRRICEPPTHKGTVKPHHIGLMFNPDAAFKHLHHGRNGYGRVRRENLQRYVRFQTLASQLRCRRPIAEVKGTTAVTRIAVD
jgi:hypothetical protein